ncbi:hypothetical protein ZeamMp004 (mitochondrion) [Zea mays subsp. mays]|jgi:hypothetical protein|uniref:Uncharacterized protein orf387 n=1 Tax=Zea mays TaxID=4577 RepID=Q6R9N9_MAIZE|nr:hypothetical protein ZeamMp004 [Zea mays subsp. mays]AAR91053.1 hypothetical protein [Zea mays]AAV67789.1 hypothetical protein [Zea mays subsp. mays]WEB51394.1 hypothetical protein [Zea mays]|eukprot:YP_588270.1 hypothetical protein ZeamMp004 (mitochondrion) [Zea mays subsp. mays]
MKNTVESLEQLNTTLSNTVNDIPESSAMGALSHSANSSINAALNSTEEVKRGEDVAGDSIHANISDMFHIGNPFNPFQCFIDNHMRKTIFAKNPYVQYAVESSYYTPAVNRLVKGLSLKDMDPIMRMHYLYMRSLLRLKLKRKIYRADFSEYKGLRSLYNRATDNLYSHLQRALEKYENFGVSAKHKVLQCLVHVVTSQSDNSVRYVYGNIFALVRLGTYVTVWYCYTESAPDFISVDPHYLDIELIIDLFKVRKLFVWIPYEEVISTSILEAYDAVVERTALTDCLDRKLREEELSDKFEFWGKCSDGDHTIDSVEENATIEYASSKEGSACKEGVDSSCKEEGGGCEEEGSGSEEDSDDSDNPRYLAFGVVVLVGVLLYVWYCSR